LISAACSPAQLVGGEARVGDPRRAVERAAQALPHVGAQREQRDESVGGAETPAGTATGGL
jgi:hypothetical protein